MAATLQDMPLLSRLAGGDLVAIEGKYHNKCLTHYKNRYRAFEIKQSDANTDPSEEFAASQVFTELVCFIESQLEDGTYLFKIAELQKLHTDKLALLGYEKSINKSRLKDCILNHFCGECQEQCIGRNTVIVFEAGMHEMLSESLHKRDFEQQALCTAKITSNVRKDMMNGNFFSFS